MGIGDTSSCLKTKTVWLMIRMRREVSLLSQEVTVSGVAWSLVSGYSKIGPRWRARVLSGWVGEIQLRLGSCLMVNKERPEQALGSQAFMYFCQVQMSHLVEARTCGNFLFLLVESVFLLSSRSQCLILFPATWEHFRKPLFVWEKAINRPPRAVPGYVS